MRLVARPRALLVVLLPVALLLVLLSLAATLVGLASPDGAPFEGYDRLLETVSVDLESNVPSWFSTSLLLLGALLLLDVAGTAHRERSRWRWHWASLVAAFLYLSVDEASLLHETGNAVLERAGVDTGLRFGWVVIALPLVVAFAAAMVPFLLALPRRTAGLFVLAGVLYVGGALGMEVVGGRVWDAAGRESAAYAVVSSAEELLEMVGAVVFAWAVADHQRRHLSAAPSAGTAGREAPVASPAADARAA